ncbi:hypothetical protein V8E52_011461 [Russula decolorans]
MFLSAAKWTGKGNLVFTASPHTTSHQLQALTPDIESLVIEYLSVFTPNPTITSRPNVKWAKLLINGVPTGVKQDRGAYTPDECHNALNSHNPIYANLRITQKPSWVRSPSSLTIGTSSSLSIAFEDPDGSQLKSLLSIRQLYLFGARAKVRRWKTALPQARTPQPSNPPSQAPLGRLEHLALPPLDLDDDIMEDPPTSAPSPRKRTLSALSPPTTAKGKKKRVTAGKLQRGDGVMKYMLVMQLFQKAIDSEVPREYGVPVLSGGRRLCVLWMKAEAEALKDDLLQIA